MSILSRAKNAVQSARHFTRDWVGRRREESLALQAEIPGSRGPLLQLRLELQAQPEGDGERLRLRGHLRLRLRRASAAALAPPRTAAERVGRWLERRLDSGWVRTLAAPLLEQEFNGWVEVQGSTAALDGGSKALLPERLAQVGVRPSDERRLETWAGALPNARGLASLTLLRLDKDDLPPRLRLRLGRKPLHLTAAAVAVLEEAR